MYCLMKPFLLIPVENQVRELDAKLLFSCAAAERGFPVILGSKQYLYALAPRYRHSILIAKSMRKRSALVFNILRDLGNRVVAWDEESLVRYCSPEYYAWRFSRETFEPLSDLFCWGDDDRRMFLKYPGLGETKVHATGNPRADLLRIDVRDYFARDKQRLVERHGDFILVNTNFPFVNPFVKRLALVSASGPNGARVVSRAGSGMSLEFAEGMAAHVQQIFDHFKRLLPALAGWFPGHKIVVRPHPSEDHEVWREALKGHGNIEIVHEGNVVPWLMACRVLLHNGCTTAVEAAALDVPAVSYQPVRSETFDYHLPNSLSRPAFTQEQVRMQLCSVLAGEPAEEPSAQAVQRILSSHLAAQTGPLGCDRILDILSRPEQPCATAATRINARYLKAYATAQIRTAIKRVNALRNDHWNSARYHAQRFPDISTTELNERIARFAGLLGRFDGVHAADVSEHVFRIEGRPSRARSA
jgi:surface carbohydrate biosynthesis protein